ncbi:hypothetical protein H0I23_03955 [Cellulophaga sp. HaHaR_3_176]|uniref:Ig-like domain-containing protein n=1 Tax=Cellulophaga sp. HaHaR_3_176 TaxID=1942464 RepID=UPI001C1F4A8B|nr:Ig-like domain-containing protein [Cellulophaga sp. HaHaR_3_176]QWX84805.1 hypothetical protein H0I23_03955 [Cellulophaga sp. HaHaR_3_176]
MIKPQFLKNSGLLLTLVLTAISCSNNDVLFSDVIAAENERISTEITEEEPPIEAVVDYQNGTIVISEDGEIALDISKDAKANSNAKTIALKSITQPNYGKTAINNNNEIVYSPTKDFHGVDSFSYTVNTQDSIGNNIEQINTMNVTINAVTDITDNTATTPYETKVYLSPLTNDTFDENTDVYISSISLPTKGTATISAENLLTYTPNNGETGVDTFFYEASVVQPNETITTETAEIRITISDDKNAAQVLSPEVLYYKNQFDIAWVLEAPEAYSHSKSKNLFQEYYFLSYRIHGLMEIWQATGDNDYLDTILELIDNTIQDASPVMGGNYLGWPADASYGENSVNNGVSLWESFLYKYVATLLRIMDKSPNLRATDNYQYQYDELLNFVETNIFEKWYYNTWNHTEVYRIKAHMASHWARISMELYLITGKPLYKEVFDNITYAGIELYSNQSIQSRIYSNTNVSGAISWYTDWTENEIQDTSHGSDIIGYFVGAYENDMYWGFNDINALVTTFDKVIWTSNSGLKFTTYIDGSGGSSLIDAGFHNYITLGRFNETLQERIEKYYTIKAIPFRESQAMGVIANNRKILDDGKPFYPEEY